MKPILMANYIHQSLKVDHYLSDPEGKKAESRGLSFNSGCAIAQAKVKWCKRHTSLLASNYYL
jgi:hypothetical protein